MCDITQDEAEIYDRQIRLWGLDAQERIRNAHVLIAGMRALSDEVCKNIALAGVGAITLLDHEAVTDEDLGAQFFLNAKSVGTNRAEAAASSIRTLNPRVIVAVDKDDVATKPNDYFESFDIVCLIHQDLQTLARVNHARRKVNKPFYAADAFGWFGYIFSDLCEHTYVEEKESAAKGSEEKLIARTSHVETYVSLNDSLKKSWSNTRSKVLKGIHPLCFVIHMLFLFQSKHKRLPTSAGELLAQKEVYLQQMGIADAVFVGDKLIEDVVSMFSAEIAPVAATVGGVLGQEIIKVLSGKGLPIQNWFYYSGLDDTGVVYQVQNEKEEEPSDVDSSSTAILL